MFVKPTYSSNCYVFLYQASSIVNGLIRSGISPQSLSVADIIPENLDRLRLDGVHTTLRNAEVPSRRLLYKNRKKRLK